MGLLHCWYYNFALYFKIISDFQFFSFQYHKSYFFFLLSSTSSIFCFRLKYLKHIRLKLAHVTAGINIFLVYSSCKHPIKQHNHLVYPIEQNFLVGPTKIKFQQILFYGAHKIIRLLNWMLTQRMYKKYTYSGCHIC